MDPKRNIPAMLLSAAGTYQEVYPIDAADPELGHTVEKEGVIRWRRNFDSFSVMIVHRNFGINVKNIRFFPNNIWTVYAIIYENHVIYNDMCKLEDGEYGGIDDLFPMSGSVTLFEQGMKLDNRKYHRVGCDFAHGHNELEMSQDIITNVPSVVDEANRLISLLSNEDSVRKLKADYFSRDKKVVRKMMTE